MASYLDMLSPDERAKALEKQALTDAPDQAAAFQAAVAKESGKPVVAPFEPGEDLRGKVPQAHPGGGTSDEFETDLAAGLTGRAKATEEMFPQPSGGSTGSPGGVVMPEGENYLPVGGKKGFEEAYASGVGNLGKLQRESGELEASKNEAISRQYEKEIERSSLAASSTAARMQSDDQELKIRQNQLNDATTRYTNDLADQNKFWSSPGNIISAIAFSLMPIAGGDPAMGAKLINQAIDRDMANRKNLADMHLGELRSNIGEYRKIAGDRNAGDAMAQAEAHRIAGLEIQRVASQFQSPIAKKNAEILAQDQMMKGEQAKEAAYNHYIYNPAKVVNPGIAGAMRAPGASGNSDAWKSFDIKGQTGSSAVQGSMSGSPSVASSGPPRTGALSTMDPVRVSALASSPSEVARLGVAGKLNKNDLTDMFGRINARRAAAVAGDPSSPGFKQKFAAAMDGYRTKADIGVAEIAKHADPLQAGMAVTERMQRDMGIIKAECEKAGITPNEWLGAMRGVAGASTEKWNEYVTRYFSSSSPEDKASGDAVMASQRFHQALAGKVVQYYHDIAGVAQRPEELEALGSVISRNSSWEKIEGFIEDESRNYGKRFNNAILAATDPNSAILYMAQRGSGTPRIPSKGIPAPKTSNPISFTRGATPASRDVEGPGALPSEPEISRFKRSMPPSGDVQ